jgi:sortase A
LTSQLPGSEIPPRHAGARAATWRHGKTAAALEGICWGIAVLALGWFCFVHADSFVFQANAARKLDALLHANSKPAAPGIQDVPAGTPLGRIEIPHLRLSAVVVQGDDDLSLRRAVGHIPGTALPGDSGNVVLAAHRDSFFRGLGKLHTGDLIVLKDARGTQRYRVALAAVVAQDDVDVLKPSNSSVLTLVTCYPFRYVGSAPDRYVVSASQVSGNAGANGTRDGL